jgi:Tfp pilus assembly protein PilO
MPNNLPSINLVANKQIPLFDKFMNWALTIGRLIVIITEVVAVIAFIYRFSLDEKLIDLHSAIKQKQNIVSVLKNDENKYRNLQDRIALATTFSAKGNKTNQTIAEIASLIPKQARINDLILNKDRVSINVDVAFVSSLADFINSLKSYRGIKSISIDNIENKPSAGLSVNITTMLK